MDKIMFFLEYAPKIYKRWCSENKEFQRAHRWQIGRPLQRNSLKMKDIAVEVNKIKRMYGSTWKGYHSKKEKSRQKF